MNNIGNMYKAQGRWDQALEAYEKSLKISKDLDDPIGIVETCINMGKVYSLQGQQGKALEVYTRSLAVLEKPLYPGFYHPDQADTYMGMGLAYKSQNQLDRALKTYKKSLKSLEELDDNHRMAVVHSSMGNVYRSQGKWDDALKAYTNSLNLMEEPEGKAQVYYNIGMLHQSQGQGEEASEAYKDSLKFLDKIHKRKGEGDLLYADLVQGSSGLDVQVIIRELSSEDKALREAAARTLWKTGLPAFSSLKGHMLYHPEDYIFHPILVDEDTEEIRDEPVEDMRHFVIPEGYRLPKIHELIKYRNRNAIIGIGDLRTHLSGLKLIPVHVLSKARECTEKDEGYVTFNVLLSPEQLALFSRLVTKTFPEDTCVGETEEEKIADRTVYRLKVKAGVDNLRAAVEAVREALGFFKEGKEPVDPKELGDRDINITRQKFRIYRAYRLLEGMKPEDRSQFQSELERIKEDLEETWLDSIVSFFKNNPVGGIFVGVLTYVGLPLIKKGLDRGIKGMAEALKTRRASSVKRIRVAHGRRKALEAEKKALIEGSGWDKAKGEKARKKGRWEKISIKKDGGIKQIILDSNRKMQAGSYLELIKKEAEGLERDIEAIRKARANIERILVNAKAVKKGSDLTPDERLDVRNFVDRIKLPELDIEQISEEEFKLNNGEKKKLEAYKERFLKMSLKMGGNQPNTAAKPNKVGGSGNTASFMGTGEIAKVLGLEDLDFARIKKGLKRLGARGKEMVRGVNQRYMNTSLGVMGPAVGGALTFLLSKDAVNAILPEPQYLLESQVQGYTVLMTAMVADHGIHKGIDYIVNRGSSYRPISAPQPFSGWGFVGNLGAAVFTYRSIAGTLDLLGVDPDISEFTGLVGIGAVYGGWKPLLTAVRPELAMEASQNPALVRSFEAAGERVFVSELGSKVLKAEKYIQGGGLIYFITDTAFGLADGIVSDFSDPLAARVREEEYHLWRDNMKRASLFADTDRMDILTYLNYQDVPWYEKTGNTLHLMFTNIVPAGYYKLGGDVVGSEWREGRLAELREQAYHHGPYNTALRKLWQSTAAIQKWFNRKMVRSLSMSHPPSLEEILSEWKGTPSEEEGATAAYGLSTWQGYAEKNLRPEDQNWIFASGLVDNGRWKDEAGLAYWMQFYFQDAMNRTEKALGSYLELKDRGDRAAAERALKTIRRYQRELVLTTIVYPAKWTGKKIPRPLPLH